MAILSPTKTRLSSHFLLSDMMGCHSVYALGLPNVFDKQRGGDIRLTNAKALCEEALEPILAMVGSFSISYGFICPALSQKIVTYQDWRKPSHHRFDLGAAVDICPHHYVLQSVAKHAGETDGAPIMFALEHLRQLPLSRLITYSESPYICIAVSAEEVETQAQRMAWYENRYEGRSGDKPKFNKYPSQSARERAFERLQDEGLPTRWTGKGYPTYHGGGNRQYHHMRTSKHTMVSDWLYDEEWVTKGIKNAPVLNNAEVARGFKVAGEVYEAILEVSGLPRLSIVSAYTSHLSKGWIPGRDWRGEVVSFEVVPPEYLSPVEFAEGLNGMIPGVECEVDEDRVIIWADKNHVEKTTQRKA